MIRFSQACVRTGAGAVLLQPTTLEVGDRRTAVIGANGSGKTTLARLVNGLTLPTDGTVSVDGRDVVAQRAEVQRRVGFVFQHADHQIVYPTPLEDVALGLRARGLSRRDARAAALAALDQLGLRSRADQAIHTLSGGEKHLVALCGVLALGPEWLVLDEPTTALDLVNRRRVVEVLDGLAPRLLVVSHDLELVAGFPRAVLLHDGAVTADGAPEACIAAYLARVAA
ncbi:MAG: ABC transporter ATP-binding protein [Thermoleophilia bacterium]